MGLCNGHPRYTSMWACEVREINPRNEKITKQLIYLFGLNQESAEMTSCGIFVDEVEQCG